MDRIYFSLIIYLLIIFSCNQLIAEENIEMKKFQLSDAIKLGKDFLIKLDPKIWDKELEIIADSENSEWKKYTEIDPSILKDPDIKKLSLMNVNYWVIYYSTKPKNIAPNAIWHGPEAFIFIDCNSRDIIHFLLW